MTAMMNLLAISAIVLSASSPALAQTMQSITLQKGQAVRITPEGQVDIVQMQGDAAHLAEMEKRSRPITKGLAVWIGEDGKLRYLTDPVDDSVNGMHR